MRKTEAPFIQLLRQRFHFLRCETVNAAAAIARAYTNPKSVRESTLLRLQKAARELGLPVPGEEAPQ